MTPHLSSLSSGGDSQPYQLTESRARLVPDSAGDLRPAAADEEAMLEIIREGPVWIAKQAGETELLINGIGRLESVIQSRDLIQLGRDGPRFVFRGVEERRHTKTMSRILSDSVATARSGATTKMRMALGLGKEFVAESVAHGTRTLRIMLTLLAITLVVGTTFLVIHLAERDRERRQDREETAQTRLELDALRRGIEDRMKSLDRKLGNVSVLSENLEQSRRKLEESLATASKDREAQQERLKSLEERNEGVRRFVRNRRKAVGFIFGVQGWKDPATKLPVRLRLAFPGGPPARRANGEAWLTVRGDGPPFRNTYFGTAFLVREDGLMVTNRHVVQPWFGNQKAEALLDQGFKPELHTLVAYFPGESEGLPIQTLEVSRKVDVAVVRVDLGDRKIAPLELAPSDAIPELGSPVILLGYPAGIAGLVVKLANRQREDLLRGSGKPDFTRMIKELASIEAVKPTITSGLLGNVLEEKLVYDAATTSGGSGGPVCDTDGRVIGVNYAVFEAFAGANFGVPVRFVHELLEKIPRSN